MKEIRCRKCKRKICQYKDGIYHFRYLTSFWVDTNSNKLIFVCERCGLKQMISKDEYI